VSVHAEVFPGGVALISTPTVNTQLSVDPSAAKSAAQSSNHW
jgi:hypothetical protein